MSLSRHSEFHTNPIHARSLSWSFRSIAVDPEQIIELCKDHPHKKHASSGKRQGMHSTWRRDEEAANVTKYKIPKVGISSKAAYQLLHDETALDGNPLLNLAS